MAAIRMFTVCLALALAGAPAQGAESLALIIANQSYKDFGDARDAFDATLANDALRAAGYQVKTIRNLSRKGLAKAAPGIRADIEDADQVILFISGHIVSTARESWLLTTDAKRQDGLVAGAYGLPIHVLADLLADKAGAAVLLVGQSGSVQRLGKGLTYGFAAAAIPQGVTVFAGRTGDLADLLRDALLSPGTSIGEVAQNAPAGVTAYGFLPSRLGLVPGLSEGQGDDPQPQEAQKSPAELARDTEAALGLSRNARRQIQRHLSLLGYDTRGVDGIFGRGTRAAVTAWQKANDLEPTSYLTGNQITALADAADALALQLEEESRLRQPELDQLDAAYWRQTGRDGDEAELRAYLKRYPDGLFSDIARDRLQVFDDEHRDSAEIAEARAWDLATTTNTEAGFDYFLGNYPDGVFADNARSRLQALREARQNTGTIQAAKQEERRVLASPITRLLVEQRLRSLGLKPGRVDGNINHDTRKAVRRFQRSAGLAVTGYINRATLVRLLGAG
jgi:peptidoglycan hydrolase-like protein with peptidoglycan-binding domain